LIFLAIGKFLPQKDGFVGHIRTGWITRRLDQDFINLLKRQDKWKQKMIGLSRGGTSALIIGVCRLICLNLSSVIAMAPMKNGNLHTERKQSRSLSVPFIFGILWASTNGTNCKS
tara:strand:- start:92 stop:436 length:345 start_codon:yes stop_codon:yes gene_type:complete